MDQTVSTKSNIQIDKSTKKQIHLEPKIVIYGIKNKNTEQSTIAPYINNKKHEQTVN
jgi:hypothetical protein